MKKKLALVIIVLLFYTTYSTSVLAAEVLIISDNNTSSITLTNFDESDRTDAVAFPIGTTPEEIAQWFSQITTGFTGYDQDGNPYEFITSTWSLEDIDTSKTGVYYAYTLPDIGTEYSLSENVSLPRELCAVSIQAPGEPDINCCVAGRGFLHFPWVLSPTQAEQLAEFTLWLQKDNEEGNLLLEGFLFVSDGLQLSQQILTYGSIYNLKVTYSGGQTGTLNFQYDGTLSILDYSYGDRDGGDVNSSDSVNSDSSLTGSQPAPTQSSNSSSEDCKETSKSEIAAPYSTFETENTSPEPATTTPKAENSTPNVENDSAPNPIVKSQEINTPSPSDNTTLILSNSVVQESTPVTEYYSPTQTIISGMRLKDLCKEEENVVFGSGNLTVSLPSKLLLPLVLSDTDMLTVTLTQPDKNQISLKVTVSGKPITQLPGSSIRYQYIPPMENTDIAIKNENGEQISDVSYEQELLCFAANEAGTYTILHQTSTNETKKEISLLIPISSSILLTAGGFTLFWRKRHE